MWRNRLVIFHLSVILLCLVLPYFIFNEKLFIGGDDTRLYYIYPIEWLKNISLYSWFHFSTAGSNNPNQFIIPFLLIASVLNFLIPSKIVVDYLFFSLPLILGYIFMQKLQLELYSDKNSKIEYAIAALFYIFSPIIIINQLAINLYPVWLIGGIPILLLLFLKYLRTGNLKILLIASITSIIFAILFASIPWFFGFLLSTMLPVIFLLIFFTRQQIFLFTKRSMIFICVIVFSQAYWIIPFTLNFLLIHKGSFSSQILSKSSGDTFSPTVLATATGNILYPLLNLFHREIAFSYNWPLKQIFLVFYDKTWYLSLLYIFIIIFGLFSYKKFLPQKYRMIYFFLLLTFVNSLFLFTVNIDILKSMFLLFGKIPGFVMFRNFYDKLAFGFVFFYATFFGVSLIIFNNRFKQIRPFTNLVIIFIIFVSIIPIKQIVNKPLWMTNDIYTTANFPQEYTSFLTSIKNTIKDSSNILSLPYNIGAYIFVRDGESNNFFIGTSPLQILTGINDFSGELSFKSNDAELYNKALVAKNYIAIQKILEKYAINYVFITNNIPEEIKKTYLFNPKVLIGQNNDFLSAIVGKRLLTSSNGNYELFQTKTQTPLISGPNVAFQKLSPVKYQITIKNLKQNETINFRDTYNYDWKLYPEKNVMTCQPFSQYPSSQTYECAKKDIFTFAELRYLLIDHIPDVYHSQENDFGNRWVINYSYIRNHINPGLYSLNKDGSIDMDFTLYFLPQTYFYLGTFVSLIVLLSLSSFILIQYKKKQ